MLPALPPCTQVIIETTKPIESRTAKPGDFFAFKSIGAVTFQGRIVIPSGTPGFGVVTLAVAAGRGHGGAIGLEPLYFKFANGDEIHVIRDRRPNALAAQGYNGQLPGYVGAVPIPGVGLVIGAYNALHKGKDVTIAPGALASVFASDSPDTAKCQSNVAPG
jgi:hypothetical protein